MLGIGTQVRLSLTHPETIHGDKLQGHFRSTDHRYRYAIYTIHDVTVTPGLPPMYQLIDSSGKIFQHWVPIGRLQVVGERTFKK